VLPLSEPHDVPGAHLTPRFDVNRTSGGASTTLPDIVFACLTE
jgi:hypothetical protein